MGGALIGWLPLGRAVQLEDGRPLIIDAGAIDDWAHTPNLLVPILMEHDASQPVGWATRARLKVDCLYLFGELDDTFDPRSRAAGRVIRAGVIKGLSPLVRSGPGLRMYANGRWGPGDVLTFPELSVVGDPRVRRAHWEAPAR